MIILKPLSKERIWGTPRLHGYSGDSSIEKIGSVYSVSGIKELSNEILLGDKNANLYEAIKENPSKFGLEENQNYPVIISFTAADEDLSIQLHPTDGYAKEHENEPFGKSESWYFLEQPKNKWIYADSLIEDKALIKDLIMSGDFEQIVGKKGIAKGDLVYIESGTLHALTKGALVYEIQQSTDITYRFYDYDRLDRHGEKRELHLSKAIETLEPKKTIKVSTFEENSVVKEKPYSLIRTKSIEKYLNENTIAEVLTVIKGTVKVNGHTIKQGISCLVMPKEEVLIDYLDDAEIILATPELYFT